MRNGSCPKRPTRSARFFLPAIIIPLVLTACSDLPSGAPDRAEEPLPPNIDSRAYVAVVDHRSRECEDGEQASGALYRICVPEPWNGDLVVYAHGYTAFNEPLAIRDEEIEEGLTVSQLVNELGFAFVTSSYRVNGLAVRPGMDDLVEAVEIFESSFGPARRVYLVGVSEGGIITALAMEDRADVFDGGLAGCGPVGDFRKQINYFGDFRVIFDYFFPGVLPGAATAIPADVIENFETVYVPQIESALAADPDATRQLLRVTRAPYDRFDRSTIAETVVGVLWYNVFATNDGVEKLGGQPFDNHLRWYHGSDNDLRLNLRVARFRADPAALTEIADHYQTSGRLPAPVVTLHTTGDPIIPYFHEPLYRWKTITNGSFFRHVNIPVLRYGHCEFELPELLVAFAILIIQTSHHDLVASSSLLPTREARDRFLALAREHGADPLVVQVER